MSVLVDAYVLKESNRFSIPTCNECDYVPVWEVRQQLVARPSVGYSCSEHIGTVLYLVSIGRLTPPSEAA